MIYFGVDPSASEYGLSVARIDGDRCFIHRFKNALRLDRYLQQLLQARPWPDCMALIEDSGKIKATYHTSYGRDARRRDAGKNQHSSKLCIEAFLDFMPRGKKDRVIAISPKDKGPKITDPRIFALYTSGYLILPQFEGALNQNDRDAVKLAIMLKSNPAWKI